MLRLVETRPAGEVVKAEAEAARRARDARESFMVDILLFVRMTDEFFFSVCMSIEHGAGRASALCLAGKNPYVMVMSAVDSLQGLTGSCKLMTQNWSQSFNVIMTND